MGFCYYLLAYIILDVDSLALDMGDYNNGSIPALAESPAT